MRGQKDCDLLCCSVKVSGKTMLMSVCTYLLLNPVSQDEIHSFSVHINEMKLKQMHVKFPRKQSDRHDAQLHIQYIISGNDGKNLLA